MYLTPEELWEGLGSQLHKKDTSNEVITIKHEMGKINKEVVVAYLRHSYQHGHIVNN